MRILQVLENPSPIGLVTVELTPEDKITEDDLKMDDSVTFKFLKLQYLKCFDYAHDKKFKGKY
jgi:hypothetical protein